MNGNLVCANCGKAFSHPVLDSAQRAAFVVVESARCRRYVDVVHQRQALAARMQGGVAGMVGHDTADTVDLVAQRASLRKLDVTLMEEEEALKSGMSHIPDLDLPPTAN